MNPKPLVSLNHFTVPVGIAELVVEKDAGCARARASDGCGSARERDDERLR